VAAKQGSRSPVLSTRWALSTRCSDVESALLISMQSSLSSCALFLDNAVGDRARPSIDRDEHRRATSRNGTKEQARLPHGRFSPTVDVTRTDVQAPSDSFHTLCTSLYTPPCLKARHVNAQAGQLGSQSTAEDAPTRRSTRRMQN
jgi:hypothetical protein